MALVLDGVIAGVWEKKANLPMVLALPPAGAQVGSGVLTLAG